MTATCAWCDAPKQSSLVCPQCGADYAKAEAIKSKGKAESVLTSSLENTLDSSVDGASDTFLEDTDSLILVKDPAFEKTVCLFALPGMLCFALFVQVTGFLSGMQRIFFAMPIHELGHAVSGWLCTTTINQHQVTVSTQTTQIQCCSTRCRCRCILNTTIAELGASWHKLWHLV